MLAEQTKTALGSGSGRSRNSWAQNFACKSAQGKMATASHVNSAHDNSISEATEAISACRNQFRARSIKTKGTNFGSIKMYMVEVFVHANPADGQPTQHARDFKLGCVLTSPRQFHQDNSGHQNAVLTGITLADGREWKETHCIYISGAKSWLLCVLASLPTSRPALRDVQIEQWSINQSLRALTTYTAFLHAGYILELGTGMPFSSGV